MSQESTVPKDRGLCWISGRVTCLISVTPLGILFWSPWVFTLLLKTRSVSFFLWFHFQGDSRQRNLNAEKLERRPESSFCGQSVQT